MLRQLATLDSDAFSLQQTLTQLALTEVLKAVTTETFVPPSPALGLVLECVPFTPEFASASLNPVVAALPHAALATMFKLMMAWPLLTNTVQWISTALDSLAIYHPLSHMIVVAQTYTAVVASKAVKQVWNHYHCPFSLLYNRLFSLVTASLLLKPLHFSIKNIFSSLMHTTCLLMVSGLHVAAFWLPAAFAPVYGRVPALG